MSESRRKATERTGVGTGPSWVAFTEGLGIAWAAMKENRLRSVLTILGVAVGVSVVVAIGALMTGLRSSVMEAFEGAGPKNFVVSRFDFAAITITGGGNDRPPWWGKPEIEPLEARRIADLPTIREALFDLGNFPIDVTFESAEVQDAIARGVASGWSAYSVGRFVAGRDFTPGEVEQNRAVVVLSAGLAQELFGRRDPVGRWVRITNRGRTGPIPFTVVGVYEPEENIFSSALPNWVVFPWTTGMRRLRRSNFQAQILVVPEDSVSMERAQDDVIQALRGFRGLGPRDENDFVLMASMELAEMFNQLTAVFFLVILLLASAGLLVGGVGVIGIMLISVTERTREIGIRKAVGATRREILWQFLVEASFLTSLGAAAGLLAGWGLSRVVARLTPLPAAIPLWSVGAALAMAVLTGMLFGLLPAYRASRLEPVDALRFE
ncbi:MAG: ABC transporter permease [Longimicrobiales bacterium]|nr:ABC transporter permease [Longimicrobiales bacterium]